MNFRQVGEVAASFGLPVTTSVVGMAITTGDGAMVQLIGGAIGAVCGLLSTIAHGYFKLQHTKHQAYVKELEIQAKRYRSKLKAAGIDADTQDEPETKTL